MPNVFKPRLDILPTAQRRLWLELAQTPSHVRRVLIEAVQATDPSKLPKLNAVRTRAKKP